MKSIAYLIILLIGLYGVYGFEVISPQEKIYYVNDIEFNVISNVTLDNISYVLDGNYTFACSNCSSYNENKTLLPGNHNLNVSGTLGNVTESTQVQFEIKDIDLKVLSPLNISYYDKILLKITTGVNASISYRLNNNSYTACLNCTLFESVLDLDDGHYNLTVTATKDNVTQQKLISFTVVPKPKINLKIVSPMSKTYYSGNISLVITTNINTSISYSLNNENFSGCSDCKRFETMINLQNGTYTLKVNATVANQTEQKSVTFRVMDRYNKTMYNYSRFDIGFNKLPWMFEHGNVNDEELAEILRSFKLNPGIINRLIKSKKLGKHAIDSILSYQFMPVGIYRKFLIFVGIPTKGYADLIAEYYGLDDEMGHKILTRNDINDDFAEKVKKSLESHRSNDTPNIALHEEEDDTFVAGNMHGKGIVKSKNKEQNNKKWNKVNSLIENNSKNEKNTGNDIEGKNKRENENSRENDSNKRWKDTIKTPSNNKDSNGNNGNNGNKITGDSVKSGNNGKGNNGNNIGSHGNSRKD